MNRTDALLALSQGHCVKFGNGDIRKVIDDKVKCWYGPREKWSDTEYDINNWQLPAETVPNPELSKDAKIEVHKNTIENFRVGQLEIVRALWAAYSAIAYLDKRTTSPHIYEDGANQLFDILKGLDKL